MWEVNTYYINIGVGDAAIHVLQHDDKFMSMALVDGGQQDIITGVTHHSLGNVQRITDTLEFIRVKHGLNEIPKFESVVITHWDYDHYGGVLKLIQDHMVERQPKKWEVDFFKYELKPGKPANAKKSPKNYNFTKIYCPSAAVEVQPVGPKCNIKSETDVAGWYWFGLATNNGAVDGPVINKLGIIAWNRSKILSRNLFSTKFCEDNIKPTLTGPKKLVEGNDPDSGAWLSVEHKADSYPGLYVIAVDGQMLHQGHVDGAADANSSSITTMIMWTDVDGKVRISHYCAGDMPSYGENIIANWTQTTGDQSIVGQHVTTMKLSHHGATNSTPLSLLLAFNPKKFIVSAGNKYGHPRWEHIYLLRHFIMLNGYYGPDGTKQVYSTRYPYFLLRDMNDASRFRKNTGISIDAFYDPNATSHQDILSNLQNVHDKIRTKYVGDHLIPGNPYDSFVADVQAWRTANNLGQDEMPSTDVSYQWILQRAEFYWNEISHIGPESHPAMNSTNALANQAANQGMREIQFIFVRSTSDHTDGEVGVKYIVDQDITFRDPPVPQPTHVFARMAVQPNKLQRRALTTANTNADTKQFPLMEFPDHGILLKLQRPRNPVPIYSACGDATADVAERGFNPHEMDLEELNKPPTKPRKPGEPISYLLPQPLGEDIYLCSRRIRVTAPKANIVALEVQSNLGSIINALHTGVLALDPVPKTPGSGADPATEVRPVSRSDELGLWLTKYFDVAEMTLSTTKNNPSDVKSISISVSNELTLTFSTAAVLGAFKFSPLIPPGTTVSAGSVSVLPASTEFEQLGILYHENTIVFGIDLGVTPAVKDVSFASVLRFGGLSRLASSVWMIVFSGLRFELDVRDPDPATAPEFSGHRNALWFNPEHSYRTTMRLQYSCTKESLDGINSWIPFSKDHFKIESVKIVTTKEATWQMKKKDREASSSSNLDMVINCAAMKDKSVIFSLQTSLELKPNDVVFTIQVQKAAGLTEVLDWLVSATNVAAGTGFEGSELKNWLGKAEEKVKLPQIRRITLSYKVGKDGKVTGGLQSARVDLELGITIGSGDGATPVPFLVTYRWLKRAGSNLNALRGSLWFKSPNMGSRVRLLPGWEDYKILKPLSVENQTSGLDLRHLGGKNSVQYIPEGLPTIISQAAIEISTDGLGISGTIMGPEPEPGDFPKPYLGSVSLGAFYGFKDGPSPGLSLVLTVRAGLIPRSSAKHKNPVELFGLLSYQSKGWLLSASVRDLYISHLLDFFDQGTRSDVVAVMENIHIKSLELTYQYQKSDATNSSVGSSFEAKGILGLGKLELGLRFNRSPTGWTFNADLDIDLDAEKAGSLTSDPPDPDASQVVTTIQTSSTIGEIIDSIVGPGHDLPGFLTDIEIKRPSGGGSPIGLNCKSNKEKKNVLFSAWVNVDMLGFSFIQYKAKDGAAKRVLKASVQELPKVDIPLVGSLTQPFSEMYFMWVDDSTPSQQSSGVTKGITKREFDEINEYLDSIKLQKLLYKKTKEPKDNDIVLNAGWHFIVVMKDQKDKPEVILDYVFEKEQAAQRDKTTPASSDQSVAALESSKNGKDNKDASATKGAPQMAPLKKKMGPLSIKNIGFEYKDDTLWLLLDATLEIGPISFTANGLGIGVEFGKGVTLHNLSFENIHAQLQGLVVSFDKAPVTIVGMYMHYDSPDMEYYAGGIVVGFVPWKFQAAGFYGKKKTGNKEISIFVFLKLDGPLISFGFAEISGITGGFGYNLDLRWPAVQDVRNFPFVAMDQAAEDPAKQLDALLSPGAGGWINPNPGSMWVAAGLKASAFKVLSVDAIIIVQWSPSVKIGVFGVAVCDVPDTKAKKKFAHLEMGMLATIDPEAGVMRTEAQLSPTSFILDPSCHLRGGFALYYWWKSPSQIEGAGLHDESDWVFSAGGYHPNFQIPAHYPKPERLSISWSWNDTVSILGEAYFAITPKVCMGGGHLRATLSLGPLSAYFDATVDFLIKYDPFFFMGDCKVSVGIKYDMDIWFIHIHINIHIGAEVHIEGPPVAGYVHVDFWVFGFDIAFGNKGGVDKDRALELAEFYNLVLQAGTGPKAAAAPDLSDSADGAHIFSAETGVLAPSKTATPSTTTPWRVQPGYFSFNTTCRFPVSTIAFGDKGASDVKGKDQLLAKPTQDPQPLRVDLKIKIQKKRINSGGQASLGDDISHKWNWALTTKAGPAALWGLYKADEDPTKSLKRVDDLLKPDGGSSIIPSGFRLVVPPSTPATEVIPAFKAIDAMRYGIDAKQHPFFKPASSEWQPNAVQHEDMLAAYQAVREAWKRPDKQAVANGIACWSDALGWGQDGAKLKGTMPDILVRDLEELLVAPPLLGRDVVG